MAQQVTLCWHPGIGTSSSPNCSSSDPAPCSCTCQGSRRQPKWAALSSSHRGGHGLTSTASTPEGLTDLQESVYGRFPHSNQRPGAVGRALSTSPSWPSTPAPCERTPGAAAAVTRVPAAHLGTQAELPAPAGPALLLQLQGD